jgi:Zn-dependent protease
VSHHTVFRVGDVRFGQREIRDLAAAWVALAVAFTVFLNPWLLRSLQYGQLATAALVEAFTLSLITVGSGFLLHELAHKVAAIRFGQVAEFRADYGMLGLAIVAALAGFLFAAPGAVHHRGYITKRENGIIALAGPLTNVALAALFFPVWLLFGGFLGSVGGLGVLINVILAAFNMIPFGPLDGKTVLAWNKLAFAAVFVPTVAVSLWFILGGLL